MIIYNYDPETKIFTNACEADQDPLEEGNFLIPANATEIGVPSLKENEYAVFTGVEWEVKVVPPAPEPTPEDIQRKKNAEARAYLFQTDWYIIRFQETGELVPVEVLEKRKDARASIVE